MLARQADLWVGGTDGLARSTDDGASFKAVELPTTGTVRALAVEDDASMWVGGGHHGSGLLCFRRQEGSFKTVRGLAEVTCMTTTRAGVVIGDRSGAVWLGRGGKVRRVHEAERPVRTVFATTSGTLLAVVGAPEQTDDVALLRSTNAGESFVETPLSDLALRAMAQLPSGVLVAAGDWGVIAMSSDDGQTFERVPHDATKSEGDLSVACAHDGAVLVAGDVENLIEVRVASASRSETGGTKGRTPKKRPRPRGRGYVGRGKFERELEALTGGIGKRAKPPKRAARLDEALDALPARLASELDALYDLLHGAKRAPRLCGLRLGAWISIPAQHGLDAEGVVDAEWFDDPADAALLVSAVEIFNDQGSPFVIVGTDGVYLLHEDPHEYALVADDLEGFLRALLAVEAAARGKCSPEEAEEVLTERIYVDEDERFPSFFHRRLPN
mgnify:CR=1 FL=1